MLKVVGNSFKRMHRCQHLIRGARTVHRQHHPGPIAPLATRSRAQVHLLGTSVRSPAFTESIPTLAGWHCHRLVRTILAVPAVPTVPAVAEMHYNRPADEQDPDPIGGDELQHGVLLTGYEVRVPCGVSSGADSIHLDVLEDKIPLLVSCVHVPPIKICLRLVLNAWHADRPPAAGPGESLGVHVELSAPANALTRDGCGKLRRAEDDDGQNDARFAGK